MFWLRVPQRMTEGIYLVNTIQETREEERRGEEEMKEREGQKEK